MAVARFSQDEFLCPVCLDLLKDPVAIPCGHSYCKICITGFWDQEDQMRVYSCPQCRQTFSPRPALALNTMLAEVVEKLKKRKLPADCYDGAGDVQCDVCTERKHKAVKSCLVCLNSYCQNHLEQHESFFKRKRHNLTEATGRLQEMICQKHDKLLEVFCHTDQKCICVLCIDEHKNHDTVSAAAQRTEKQERYNNALTHTRSIVERTIGQLKRRFYCLHSELRIEPSRACKIIVACVVLFNMSKTYSAFGEEDELEEEGHEAEEAHEANHLQQDFQQAGFVVRDAIHQLKETQRLFQQRIQQRQKDLQQLREVVESHKRSAQTAVEDSERIFTELIRSIERSRSEATQRIRDQEKTAVSRAEGRLERLEQEINDLRRRDTELEQLLHTQDHIHFLQSSQSLSAPPESTDINDRPFSSLSSFDGVRESVHQLRDKLEDFCKEELKKFSDRVAVLSLNKRKILFVNELNELVGYISFVDEINESVPDSHQLTLDLNTAHKRLRLSERNRVISGTFTEQPYPDHPDRFDVYLQVLCRESVCDRRCYWEIEWSGDGVFGVFISVSYKSISRKGRGNERLFGRNDHSWGLFCSSSSYLFRHNKTETKLLAAESISSRIGVYVDHSAGTLSFYSVSGDTMILIHTVQTTFTQPLYPGFRVGPGSSVKLC
ncbi:Tripartite motif-containing protein 16 [Anabarilius grahami]|uniref:Tripartite motif-containing protein 16 n=1 Tax=Anabarilius grahami TaxID=495550 RepID=A0A3N0XSC4_ANAGA|nr:Tripartite motif-containing protein 16 [Anabarilius grahami]